MSPERRSLARYVFSGGELYHLGHMIQCMKAAGFDVQDVEGWRDHYSMTSRHWVQQLQANREEGIRQVGVKIFRMWTLCLTGCVFALGDGGARIYQRVATAHGSRGLSGMPCTREHLYRKPRAEFAE